MSTDKKSLFKRQKDLKARMEAERSRQVRLKNAHAPSQGEEHRPTKADPPQIAEIEEQEYDMLEYHPTGFASFAREKVCAHPIWQRKSGFRSGTWEELRLASTQYPQVSSAPSVNTWTRLVRRLRRLPPKRSEKPAMQQTQNNGIHLRGLSPTRYGNSKSTRI